MHHDQYVKIEDQIDKICRPEEDIKYEKWLHNPANYGVKPSVREKKRDEFLSEVPLSKEIIEKWTKLKNKIIDEFNDICNQFGMVFDMEVYKDCLEKCHFVK